MLKSETLNECGAAILLIVEFVAWGASEHCVFVASACRLGVGEVWHIQYLNPFLQRFVMPLHIRICLYIYIYIYVCVCVFIYLYGAYVYVDAHICIYTYISIYIYR